jgi:hypothetical protein
MKDKLILSIFTCFVLAIAGCKTTRSISNSGYQETHSARPVERASDAAFQYRGELSEFELLGITHDNYATEDQIKEALDAAKRVQLTPSSSILLIQSGATIPDGSMTTSLAKHFDVVPFSGIPGGLGRVNDEDGGHDRESFSKSLRLAAARGRNDIILCYWGTLESADENLTTHAVSWVPVVGWMLPDKREHVRILLKIALIDVRSGNWTLFSPEPFKDTRLSSASNRESADQKLIERLKSEAYAASADELVRRFCSR